MIWYNYGDRQIEWASAALTAPPVAHQDRSPDMHYQSISLPIPGQMNTFLCEQCGNRFEAWLSTGHSLPRFCSQRCRGIANQKHPGADFVCKHCGETFHVTGGAVRSAQATGKLPQFCSRRCMYESRIKSPENPRFPLGRGMTERVLQKSGHRCWYCGRTLNSATKIHVDHFIPRALGGTHEIDNLVPSCMRCNLDKGALSVDDFRSKRGGRLFWFELQDGAA